MPRFFGTLNTDELFTFEFAAFVTLHLTLLTLILLAFRERKNSTTAWHFTGMIVVWWLLTLGMQYQRFWAELVPFHYAYMALQFSVLGRIAATLVTATLFAVTFSFRHGRQGLKTFGCVIFFTGMLSVLWWQLAWLMGGEIHFRDDHLMMREAFWMGITSWDVTANWIIWYVFLFPQPAKFELESSKET